MGGVAGKTSYVSYKNYLKKYNSSILKWRGAFIKVVQIIEALGKDKAHYTPLMYTYGRACISEHRDYDRSGTEPDSYNIKL